MVGSGPSFAKAFAVNQALALIVSIPAPGRALVPLPLAMTTAMTMASPPGCPSVPNTHSQPPHRAQHRPLPRPELPARTSTVQQNTHLIPVADSADTRSKPNADNDLPRLTLGDDAHWLTPRFFCSKSTPLAPVDTTLGQALETLALSVTESMDDSHSDASHPDAVNLDLTTQASGEAFPEMNLNSGEKQHSHHLTLDRSRYGEGISMVIARNGLLVSISARATSPARYATEGNHPRNDKMKKKGKEPCTLMDSTSPLDGKELDTTHHPSIHAQAHTGTGTGTGTRTQEDLSSSTGPATPAFSSAKSSPSFSSSSSSSSTFISPDPTLTCSSQRPDCTADAHAVADLLHVGLEPASHALRSAEVLVRHARAQLEHLRNQEGSELGRFGRPTDPVGGEPVSAEWQDVRGIAPYQGRLGPITMWTASPSSSRKNPASTSASANESQVSCLSTGGYLFSFTKFLETLFDYPAFAPACQDGTRLPPLYFFRTGGVLIKVSTQPFRLYHLQLDAPAWSIAAKGSKVLETPDSQPQPQSRLPERNSASVLPLAHQVLQEEISVFYGSLQRYLDGAALALAVQAEKQRHDHDATANDSNGDETVTRARLYSLRQILAQEQALVEKEVRRTPANQLNNARIVLADSARSAAARVEAWLEKYFPPGSVDAPHYTWPAYCNKGEETMVWPASSVIVYAGEPLSFIAYMLSTPRFQQAVQQAQREEEEAPHQAHVSRDADQRGAPPEGSLSSATIAPVSASHAHHLTLPEDKSSFDQQNVPSTMEHIPPETVSTTRSHGWLNPDRSEKTLEAHNRQSTSCDPDDPNAIFYHPDPTMVSLSGKKRSKDPPLLPFHKLRRLSSRQRDESDGRLPSGHPPGRFRVQPSARMDSSVLRSLSSTSTSLSATPEEQPAGIKLDVPPDAGGSSFAAGCREKQLDTEEKERITSPHVKLTISRGPIKVSCISWYAAEFARLRQLWKLSEEGFVCSLSRCTPSPSGGGKSSSAFFLTHDQRYVAKQLLTVWTVDETDAFLDFAPHYVRYAMQCVQEGRGTLLVRILGVYRIKIINPAARTPKRAMNFLILDNVFATPSPEVGLPPPSGRPTRSSSPTPQPPTSYGGERLLRFDLKGIRDRRVKHAQYHEDPAAHVWHDAEWIEHIQPSMLVPAEDKDRFLCTLDRDLSFLTRLDRMDYSLLVGVFPGGAVRAQLVDYLGAFTLAKQLESSSKRALKTHDGKHNVTILPPAEYAARLQHALRDYFVACPTDAAIGSETPESSSGAWPGGGKDKHAPSPELEAGQREREGQVAATTTTWEEEIGAPAVL